MSNTALLDAIDSFVFKPLPGGRPSVLLLNRPQANSGLRAFFKKYSPKKQSIEDSEALEAAQKGIENTVKYVKPAKKLASYAAAIMDGISVGEGGFSLGLSGLLNYQPPCAVEASLPKLFLIDEDSIPANKLAAFLSLFQQIDSDRRPSTIFVSKADKIDKALKTLSACGEQIDAHLLSHSGAVKIELDASQCTDSREFIEHFLSEADGSCLETDINEMMFDNGPESKLSILAMQMLQIQSMFRSGRKFECRQKLVELQEEVELFRQEKSSSESQKQLLSIKAILNLWQAFASESFAEKIENSIAIADHLNDQLLLAHGLKLTGLVHGYSTLTRQMLEKARDIFVKYGEDENELFVQNNLLVNSLYSSAMNVEAASSLSNYVAEVTPFIRRSTTFHSNAAIAHLLNGNTNTALSLFDRANGGSGPPVNSITSDINRKIALYLDGSTIPDEELWKVFNRIKRANMPREFDYHQTAMLGNLWKLGETNKDFVGEIREYLRERKFLDYGDDINSPDEVLLCSVQNIPSVKRRMADSLPGLLGEFIQKHKFVLPAHVFYR